MPEKTIINRFLVLKFLLLFCSSSVQELFYIFSQILYYLKYWHVNFMKYIKNFRSEIITLFARMEYAWDIE